MFRDNRNDSSANVFYFFESSPFLLVEIQLNWIIYRKEEISLVKAVANKKGFRR